MVQVLLVIESLQLSQLNLLRFLLLFQQPLLLLIFLLILHMKLLLSFSHSLFRLGWFLWAYFLILAICQKIICYCLLTRVFWRKFFSLLFHNFTVSWWLFKDFQRSQPFISISLRTFIIFFFLQTPMLKCQRFYSHLLQLPIHGSNFKALSAHRALFSLGIRGVLLVFLDAFWAE